MCLFSLYGTRIRNVVTYIAYRYRRIPAFSSYSIEQF